MKSNQLFSIAQVADMLGVSKETLRRWDKNGKLKPIRDDDNNYRFYSKAQLEQFEQARLLFNSSWDEEQQVQPLRDFTVVELFAGAGGLALGLERAGFKAKMLNEIDKHACDTLRFNRPNWNVCQSDISKVDFNAYQGVDVVSGGFPCQAFSYAGKKLGFEDTRGTLFFEFSRAVKELQPKLFVAENVRGILNHDKGKTLETISKVLSDFGYEVKYKLLDSVNYFVPQKRQRVFIVGTKPGYKFDYPKPFDTMKTIRDALKNCPKSIGAQYSEKRKKVYEL